MQCKQNREKAEYAAQQLNQVDCYFLSHREIYVFIEKLIQRVNNLIKILNSFKNNILILDAEKFKSLYYVLKKYQQKLMQTLLDQLDKKVS